MTEGAGYGTSSPDSREPNVNRAVSDLGSQVERLHGRLSEIEMVSRETVGTREPIPRVVRITAIQDPTLDPAGRFLHAEGSRRRVAERYQYEFFGNGLLSKAPVKLPVGFQFGTIMEQHTWAGAFDSHRRACCNVFKGVLTDIPWNGRELPRAYSGPFLVSNTPNSNPRLGKISTGGLTWRRNETTDTTGAKTMARLGYVDRWGIPSGAIDSLRGNDFTPSQGSAQWAPITPEWWITPFFFYKGGESACLDFLKQTFGGSYQSGSGPDSITANHAARCITKQNSFPALIVGNLYFAVGGSASLEAWVTAQSLDNDDVGRKQATVEVLGTQQLMVM